MKQKTVDPIEKMCHPFDIITNKIYKPNHKELFEYKK